MLGLSVAAIKEIVRCDARQVGSRECHLFESPRMLKGHKAMGCKASPGTQLEVARDKRQRRPKNGDDALAVNRVLSTVSLSRSHHNLLHCLGRAKVICMKPGEQAQDAR